MLTTDRPETAPTFFAPGERLSAAQLGPFAKQVVEDPIVSAILRSIPGSVLILDRHRQILAANEDVLHALGYPEPSVVVGLRPGEAFSCIHAAEGPSGCGTSRHCRVCGAVLSMLAAMEQGEPVKGECALSLEKGNRLRCVNFSVFAAPVDIQGQACLELVFHDISDLKLKEAFERIFLHDLRNAVSAVMGWSDFLLAGEDKEVAGKLLRLSQSMMEMIESHNGMLLAESGELCVQWQTLPAAHVLDALESFLAGAAFTRGKVLHVERRPQDKETLIRTDPGLLNRILVNMTKNAFEAVGPGERVRVGFAQSPEGRAEFWVHNPGVIPENVQLSIFQRAYSTKEGIGRGFGTYGCKLIGQNFLKGEVGFSSSAEEGTRFFIRLPPSEALSH